MRWEAVRNSSWTFDTGYASSLTGDGSKPPGYHYLMEGWRGFDLNISAMPYFRRSTTCSIDGNYSLWAGVTEDEATDLCFAAGQGYGDCWDIGLFRSFQYDGSDTVSANFLYSVESEPGWDYLLVEMDTTGTDFSNPYGIILRSLSGSVSGLETIGLSTSTRTLPSSPGPIGIRFRAVSDGLYSDADGLFQTSCGLATIDNVSLSGGVTYFCEDCVLFGLGGNR
jgi:hypothetical protein